MGESQHPLGKILGKFLFYKNRGTEYTQMLRGWVTPSAMVTGVAKYYELSTWLSLTLAVCIVLVIESLGWFAGFFDIKVGGARKQVSLGNEQDPWKGDVIALLERIIYEKRQQRGRREE